MKHIEIYSVQRLHILRDFVSLYSLLSPVFCTKIGASESIAPTTLGNLASPYNPCTTCLISFCVFGVAIKCLNFTQICLDTA